MYDTNVTVVGNALNTPEYRRIERTSALVANFKVASTTRRWDKNSNRWIDGDSLRVRVTCWRRLAEGVVASIKVGDPVVVHGRLYTREWSTEDGQRRTAYELEAVSVGHDLARGVGVFRRGRVSLSTTAVEDADAENRIGGEVTEPAPEENARSEALTAGMAEELPSIGYDGPVEIDVEAPIAGLSTALTNQMTAELDEVMATAGPPSTEAPEVPGTAPATAPATVPATVPAEGADGRVRRSRSRVPANA